MGSPGEIVGAAISIPTNIIFGIADLLIEKNIISREEVASILRSLLDGSAEPGENGEMVRQHFRALLTLYESQLPEERNR
jgi:hypothetical protein